MKRLSALLILFAGFTSCLFADWTKIVAAGVSIPIVNTTIEWEDNIGSDHEKGNGFNIDGQFRLVKDTNFAFMWDLDAGYVNIGDTDGIDFSLYFGIGKNFTQDPSKKIILSGVVGVDADYLFDETKVGTTTIERSIELDNVMIGADFFVSTKLSKSFGIFAQCTATVGVGGAFAKTTSKIGGVKTENSIDGVSEIFILRPRFGFSWTF